MREKRNENRVEEIRNRHQRNKKTIRKIIIGILLTLVICCVGGFFLYVKEYYHASSYVEQYLSSDSMVNVEKEDKWISFTPVDGEYTKGFIFYPGGKVEYTAYAQMMYDIAKEGYQCVLVKMPFNLAVLDSSAAGKVRAAYPEIATWYLGGHSLGGAMAASYISNHSEEYAGLIMLAAYSTKNLSDCDFAVLSIYGENDGVLNMDKLESSNKMMPPDFMEYCIAGGNHAYYGDYGDQKGDKAALIEREDQIMETVLQITMFME